MKKVKHIKAIVSTVLTAVLAILLPVSCNILEYLDPCPRGLEVKFVYDYNMLGANAFHSQVKSCTLYVYNKDGEFIGAYSEKGDKLKDEDYRLQIDLPHGEYQLVAYAGSSSDESSFVLEKEPQEGSLCTDLKVSMKHDNHVSDQLLHDFYYGSAMVEVSGELYNKVTLRLVKNTNNIRLQLQHLNGEDVPIDKFKVRITDDNAVTDWQNNIIPGGTVTYLPWAMDVSELEMTNTKGLSASYAEFSTSRLMAKSGNRLTVYRLKDNAIVLDIPLSQYLLLLRSDRFQQMSNQEYLDRESDWSLVFFLDSRYKWINTHIIVNGWKVVLNNFEL